MWTRWCARRTCDEVRSQINEIRNFDIKGEIERAVDPDGSLRDTLRRQPARAEPAEPPAPPSRRPRRATPRPPSRHRRRARRRRPAAPRSPPARSGQPAVLPPAAAPPPPDGAGLHPARRRDARRPSPPARRRRALSIRRGTTTTDDDPINDKPMPLLDHLIELRRRLLWSIVAFLARVLRLLPFLDADLLLPGPPAGRHRCEHQGGTPRADLHRALRGVLHLPARWRSSAPRSSPSR